MNDLKFLQKPIGVILAIIFLAGCAAPAAPSPLPPTGQSTLFKFIHTVQVTPDETFQIGGLARLHYVPATNRLVIVISTRNPGVSQCPPEAAEVAAYKEYTLDMQPTGNYGVFNCRGGTDADSIMVDNSLYYAMMYDDGAGKQGWWLSKYDAATWRQVGQEIFVPVDNYPDEHIDGPALAYVNGMIDLYDVYAISGGALAPKHHLFTLDLQPLDTITLAEGPAMYDSSVMYVDGVYTQITGTWPSGDLVVRRYDQDWNFIDEKTVRQHGYLPWGLAFDGQRFYVAFQDNSQVFSSSEAGLSVHLAAFDLDWNLIEDIQVSPWTPADGMYVDCAGLLLHEDRLYVTYAALDIAETCPFDEVCPREFQAYVNVYELP